MPHAVHAWPTRPEPMRLREGKARPLHERYDAQQQHDDRYPRDHRCAFHPNIPPFLSTLGRLL
jgi:hypothetical protein